MTEDGRWRTEEKGVESIGNLAGVSDHRNRLMELPPSACGLAAPIKGTSLGCSLSSLTSTSCIRTLDHLPMLPSIYRVATIPRLY